MKIDVVMYITMIIMAALLAIGSFMGFPNDPELGGMFWVFVTLLLIVGGVTDGR